MADALAVDPNLVEHLKNIRHSQLLPEESFRWMNEGKRQIEWLHSKITFFVGAQGFIPLTGLSGKRSTNSSNRFMECRHNPERTCFKRFAQQVERTQKGGINTLHGLVITKINAR